MTVVIGPSLGPSQTNQAYETRQIAALGSLILDSPLNNSYPAGTTVVVYASNEIGLGVDKALGPGLGSGLGSAAGYTVGGLSLPSFTGTSTTLEAPPPPPPPITFTPYLLLSLSSVSVLVSSPSLTTTTSTTTTIITPP